MQIVIVVTDQEDGRISYSVFEKPQLHEKLENVDYSPAIQVGSIISGFLKTIEEHGSFFSTMPIYEEFKKKYDKDDYRDALTRKDNNVIHIDLRKIKPKGNA